MVKAMGKTRFLRREELKKYLEHQLRTSRLLTRTLIRQERIKIKSKEFSSLGFKKVIPRISRESLNSIGFCKIQNIHLNKNDIRNLRNTNL